MKEYDVMLVFLMMTERCSPCKNFSNSFTPTLQVTGESVNANVPVIHNNAMT